MSDFNYEGAAKASHEHGWCKEALVPWNLCPDEHQYHHQLTAKLVVEAFLVDNELYAHPTYTPDGRHSDE